MYYLGIDLGSSSVKLSVLNAETGKTECSVGLPEAEMEINAPKFGWAEQDPNLWWKYVCHATKRIIKETKINSKQIVSVGISYQMHGIVLIDKKGIIPI